jgi:hypothetical protein
MTEPTYTFAAGTRTAPSRSRGDTRPGPQLSAGRAIAYWPRDEKILVNDHGEITHYESAIPRLPMSDYRPQIEAAVNSYQRHLDRLKACEPSDDPVPREH